MKILKIMMLALTSIVAFSSDASEKGGHGPGNGGHAVELNGKLYLLDLAEAGVQDSPLQDLQPADQERDRFFKRADWMLRELPSSVSANVKAYIIHRLTFLGKLERNLAIGILPLYSWRMVDLPLAPIEGIRSTLDLSKATVYQAAVRRDSVILINQSTWDRLDDWNRAGLIVHELIYASIHPITLADGTLHQESWDARLIVGDLFSRRPRQLNEYVRDGKHTSTLVTADANDGTAFDTITLGVGPSGSQGWTSGVDYRPGLSITKSGSQPGTFLNFLQREPDQWLSWTPSICREVLSASAGRALMTNFYSYVTVQLKDYATAEGITKYVSTSMKTLKDITMVRFDPTTGRQITVPGSFQLSYRNQNECEADLPGKIRGMQGAFFSRYDYL